MEHKSYFVKIRQEIAQELENAQGTIWAAVAWITDQYLFDILLKKLDEGIDIKLIVRGDAINFKTDSLDWDSFIGAGGELYTLDSLHNKFAIIDGINLINGSYNWTYQAALNNENIILVQNDNQQEITINFINEFEKLIAQSDLVASPIIKVSKSNATASQCYQIEEDEIAQAKIDEQDRWSNELDDLYYEMQLSFCKMKYAKTVKIANTILEGVPDDENALSHLIWAQIRNLEKYRQGREAKY